MREKHFAVVCDEDAGGVVDADVVIVVNDGPGVFDLATHLSDAFTGLADGSHDVEAVVTVPAAAEEPTTRSTQNTYRMIGGLSHKRSTYERRRIVIMVTP